MAEGLQNLTRPMMLKAPIRGVYPIARPRIGVTLPPAFRVRPRAPLPRRPAR